MSVRFLSGQERARRWERSEPNIYRRNTSTFVSFGEGRTRTQEATSVEYIRTLYHQKGIGVLKQFECKKLHYPPLCILLS